MSNYGEVESVFSRIETERGRAYSQKLYAIINENIARERLAWYLKQNEKHTIEGYIQKVQSQYDIESTFIASLRIHKDEILWADVQHQARKNGYRLLFRLGFSQDVCELASDDIAQDACIQILSAHYPYDSVFEAWLTQICTYIGYAYARQRRVDEQKNVDIEQARYMAYENSLQAHHLEVVLGVTEDELNAAIQKLSLLQQEVIEEHYRLGISLADISKKLDIDSNTLYKRHSDARKRLGKILGK